jgi:hypothetical protein
MARAAEEVDGGDPMSGDRRLTRGETVFWYTAAGVTYIGASLVEKGLLNWFIGPLWLVTVIWLGPLAVDLVRRRRTRQAGSDR